MLLTILQRDPWEVGIGAHLNLRWWGLGATLSLWGSDAPNSLTLYIGPFSLWLTVWHWDQYAGPDTL